jgi:YihY family inner membrane protein
MSPGASSLVERVDAVQRCRPPLAVPVAVYRKFSDDRAGRLAAVMAYYGFFSLFPAMLALVTVLGYVLDNREDLRDDIQQGVLGQLPVIGDYIGDAAAQPLSGNTVALVIGLATALWAGMGAMQAAQDAVNTVFDVPRIEQPSFLKKRARSLLMLVVLGGLLVGGAVLTQVVTLIGDITLIARAALFVGTLGLNVVVFWIAYQVLIAEQRPWRALLPGAITAGIGYHLLQVVGQLYVNHVLRGAQDTYGTFATVIGLLSWLHVMAQITLLGAVVNVVTAKHLWPRHLTRGLEHPPKQRTR